MFSKMFVAAFKCRKAFIFINKVKGKQDKSIFKKIGVLLLIGLLKENIDDLAVFNTLTYVFTHWIIKGCRRQKKLRVNKKSWLPFSLLFLLAAVL